MSSKSESVATVITFTSDEALVSKFKKDIALHPLKDQNVNLINERVVQITSVSSQEPYSHPHPHNERPLTSVIGI